MKTCTVCSGFTQVYFGNLPGVWVLQEFVWYVPCLFDRIKNMAKSTNFMRHYRGILFLKRIRTRKSLIPQYIKEVSLRARLVHSCHKMATSFSKLAITSVMAFFLITIDGNYRLRILFRAVMVNYSDQCPYVWKKIEYSRFILYVH